MASIFGPMLPERKCPCLYSSLASLNVIMSSHFWSGLLKLIATFSTAVLMSRHVDLHLGRQQRACPVLVDDREDALEVALLVLDDRDPAATHAHDDEVVRDEGLDRLDLDDLERDGRGDHAAPTAARVFLHHPALGLEPFGVFLGREAADALGRVLEARVFPVDQHLGDHGGDASA